MLESLELLAEAGVFVQMPNDCALPKSLRGKIIPAQRAIRMVGRAVIDLEGWQGHLWAAGIESTMMDKDGQPADVSQYHGRMALSLIDGAEKLHDRAEIMLLAVMDAKGRPGGRPERLKRGKIRISRWGRGESRQGREQP